MKSLTREQFLALLARVPVMSFAQASTLVGSASRAREWIGDFKRKGLLTASTELVRAREVKGPLSIVKAGMAHPHAGELAYKAASLWSQSISPVLVIRAAAKLSLLHGGEPLAAVTGHVSHEVALTEALILKSLTEPDFQWLLAHSRPGLGAHPDAISLDGNVMVELIGRYNRATLEMKVSLISHCKTLEFW